MALSQQVVPMAVLGLNQKSPRSGGVTGTLATAENVIFEKGDTDGLLAQKRNGTGVIPGTGYGGFYDVFDYKGTLTQLSSDGLWSYVTASGLWKKTGPQDPPWLSPTVAPAGPAYVDCVDGYVSSGGYQATVFQGAGNNTGSVSAGVYLSISIGGTTVITNQLIDQNGCRPKVIATTASGVDVFIVAWMVEALGTGVPSASADLKFTSFTAPNWTQGAVFTADTMAPVMSVGALPPYGWFDWDLRQDGSVLVAYNSAAGILKTTVIPANGGASGPIVATGVACTHGGCVAAVDVQGNYCDIGIITVNDVWVCRIGSPTRLPITTVSLQTFGAGTCTNVVGAYDGSTSETLFAWEIRNSFTPNVSTLTQILTVRVPQVGPLPGATALKKSVGIASGISFSLGRPLIMACFQDTIPQFLASENQGLYQSTFFLIDMSTGNIVSKALVDSAGGHAAAIVTNTDPLVHRSTVPKLLAFGSRVQVSTRRLVGEANASRGAIVQYRQPVTLTFQQALTSPTLQIEGVALVLGGCPQVYDGQMLSTPFLNAPPVPTATLSAGAILGIGTYSYVCVYAWSDAAGNIYRSAPSAVVQITTTAGNQTVDLVIQPARLTSGLGAAVDIMTSNLPHARIEVYRNSQADDKTFRLVSPVDPYIASSPQTDIITFHDDVDDADQASGQPLYTITGELAHAQPPPANVGCVWQRRACLASLDDPGKIYMSFEMVEGFGPQFAGELFFWLPGSPSAPTAMAVMDDKLIIFTADGAYVAYGSPPNNAGQGSTIVVQKLPVRFGCLGPRLLDVTDIGVIHWTSDGPYLLDRGLQQKPIGTSVDDFSDARARAIISPTGEPRTYVFTSDSDTLVYDHVFGVWSTFTKNRGTAACEHAGALHWIPFAPSPDGSIRYRTNDYVDADQSDPSSMYISSKLVFNDVNFGGVEGYQAVWQAVILGEYVADHVLNVDVVYDYQATNAVTQHWERAIGPDWQDDYALSGPYAGIGPYAGSSDGTYHYVCPFKKIYCAAIRLTLWDTITDPSSPVYGGGFNLSNVVFEVGVLNGVNRIKPGNRLG